MAETGGTPDAGTAAARSWLGVAVGSLLVAGLFAVALVAGRFPWLSQAFRDPSLFRRFLVIHVDLSLVAWFCAFLAALAALAASPLQARVSRAGSAVAVAGLALLIGAGALPEARPILSNYVPALDHPLFTLALAVLGAGLALSAGAAWPSRAAGDALPEGVSELARAAALALLVALATFAASFATTPAGLAPEALWELRAWGGGHVLQVASLLGMLAAWVLLTSLATGRSPLRRASATAAGALLVLPALAGPLLAWRGTTVPPHREAFTQLMRWGTWPVTLAVLGACAWEIVAARRQGRLRSGGPLLALAASAALCITGFVLGAMIRGSSTLVPGHYHACIGAVTCAFMAVTLQCAPALGLRPLDRSRWAAVQPPLFAAGQLLFAIGFAVAGAAGMGRKVYGAEQVVRSGSQMAGLAIMGFGGLVAVAAGLLFLRIVVPALRPQATPRAELAPLPRGA